MPLFIPATPTAPSSANAETFEEDASTYLAWMADFALSMKGTLPLIADALVVMPNFGGTAAAMVVSFPSDGNSAIGDNQHIRFRPAITNNAGATLRVGNLSPLPMLTLSGATVPAGYLIAGEWATAHRTAAGWVVERRDEVVVGGVNGAPGNGEVVKTATGRMYGRYVLTGVSLNINNPYLGGFRSADQTWTFPVVNVGIMVAAISTTVLSTSAFGVILTGLNSTDCTYSFTAVTTQATAGRAVALSLVGRWY